MITYLTTVSSATFYMSAADSPLSISSAGGIDVTTTTNWGIRASAATVSIINSGGVLAATPNGAPNYGILLQAGGSVVNNLGAAITAGSLVSRGYGSGVKISGGNGTVTNAGTIQQLGTGHFHSYGITMDGAGTITNTGTISGYDAGVVLSGAVSANATLINSGIIRGTSTYFVSPGVGVNMLGPIGTVSNLAGGTIVGAENGIEADGGQITVIEAGSISAGGYAIFGVKQIQLVPGYHVSGKIAGYHGGTSLVLDPGTTAGVAIGFGTNITAISNITFAAGAAWSVSGNAAGIAGGQTFNGFAQSDTIHITGVQNETIAGFANNTLSLDGSLALNVIVPGSVYTAASFHIQNDTSGGVQLSVRCFASGTRIRTPVGDVPVEDLRRGQFVARLDDVPAEIIRIHRRAVDCRRGSKGEGARPVRILAHAFGAGRPARDLWMSPDHAVFRNDALIPIRYLVNGTTIRPAEVDQVVYYHIELAEHDVLLAEGLAVESYLANDDFDMLAGTRALGPDAWECKACAPLIVTGAKLHEARAMLAGEP
jgi:collagen type I/II/III/V/XI/XXIV/XXVII alpha